MSNYDLWNKIRPTSISILMLKELCSKTDQLAKVLQRSQDLTTFVSIDFIFHFIYIFFFFAFHLIFYPCVIIRILY